MRQLLDYHDRLKALGALPATASEIGQTPVPPPPPDELGRTPGTQ
ncbi:MAG: hypothetical protein U1F77_01625 [Kiritimatiellia bacterium]